MQTGKHEPDLKMDGTDLYREETFTDRKMGTIRRLTPVDGQGKDDPARDVLYEGHTQLLTPMGTLPLSFEIGARSLEEAVNRFPEAAQAAVDRTMEELKELRREAASSIVIPEPGGGLGGPGGGKIQLR